MYWTVKTHKFNFLLDFHEFNGLSITFFFFSSQDAWFYIFFFLHFFFLFVVDFVIH